MKCESFVQEWDSDPVWWCIAGMELWFWFFACVFCLQVEMVLWCWGEWECCEIGMEKAGINGGNGRRRICWVNKGGVNGLWCFCWNLEDEGVFLFCREQDEKEPPWVKKVHPWIKGDSGDICCVSALFLSHLKTTCDKAESRCCFLLPPSSVIMAS